MLNKEETTELVEKLLEDYDKSLWNRDATLLLQAADQLSQLINCEDNNG